MPLNQHTSKLCTHQRGDPTLMPHMQTCKISGSSTSLNTEVVTLWLLIRSPMKIPWVSCLGNLVSLNVFLTIVAWAVILFLSVRSLYTIETSSLNCRKSSYNALKNCSKTFIVVIFFESEILLHLLVTQIIWELNITPWWQISLFLRTETIWILFALLQLWC